MVEEGGLFWVLVVLFGEVNTISNEESSTFGGPRKPFVYRGLRGGVSA